MKKKKGREQMTFLIIVNISLWLLYTVTRNKFSNVLFKDWLSKDDSLALLDHLSPEYVKAEYDVVKVINPTSSSPSSAVMDSSESAQAVKWIIINTITYPLLLYFQFHSSCSLSLMWKICYSLEIDSF